MKRRSRTSGKGGGRLRIGDDWNAITIALSQNNPLKAIAEFVENSIDARARTVTLVRGREGGQHYLRVIDDGRRRSPRRRTLFDHRGTELSIRPLLPGLRQLSGERIQSYLTSELRGRIRKSGVRILIRDRAAFFPANHRLRPRAHRWLSPRPRGPKNAPLLPRRA
jgi:hypothetical protein